MRSGADILADLIKVFLHGLCVGIRHDKCCSYIARRTDSAKNIAGGIALIFGLARARTFFRPLIDQTVFLSHPCLILKPDFNRRARCQTLCRFSQPFSEVFYIPQWLVRFAWDAVDGG